MVSVQKGEYEKFKDKMEKEVTAMAAKITELENKNLSLIREKGELTIRVNNLENKLNDLETKLAATTTEITNISSNISNQTPNRLFSNLFESSKCNEIEAKIIHAVRREQLEDSKKDKNVLIFGTKFNDKDNEDEALVHEVFRSIGVANNKIKSIRRFSNKNSQVSTPILIEMNDISCRLDVLRNAKKLRDTEQLKEIFIGPDQTQAEREFTKSLIAKRNDLNSKLAENSSFR